MRQHTDKVVSASMNAAALVVSAFLLIGTSSSAVTTDVRVIEAAKRHDTRTISELLKRGADVNTSQADGATALHWAVYLNDHATVDLLLRARANINVRNDLGITPLFLACTNANAVIAAKLLDAGADTNTATPSGQTSLMTAARSGSAEIVKALLSHRANVNAVEAARGQTALMWAAANGHASVVQTLIEGGADINTRSHVYRLRVVVGGDRAAEVDAGGFTALFFAARSGDIESAKALLKAGANVNDTTRDQTSVLTFAAHSGHGGLARFLLESRADPNAEGSGYTALHAAVLRGDADVVKALLAYGANPNARLKHGTPVNRNSKDFAFLTEWIGATPFWLAAKFAEVEIMRTLLEGGADPHLTLPDGTTALMAAAGLGRVQNPAAQDRRGRRRDPMEFAAVADTLEHLTLEAVKVATDAGIDVNAVNDAGDTAVHAAAGYQTPSVVQWLADRGAALDVKNKRGQTALSIANTKRRGQSDEGSIDIKTVELLRRLGATQ